MRLIDTQLKMLRDTAVRRGFTLTELLVVIGIIIALIALLIPALAHVRKKGKEKEAEAQLVGISESLNTYHTTFGAYPGPMATPFTASKTGKVLSGSQNMLMGLSYTIYPGTPPNTLQISASFSVDPTTASGPNNLAVVSPTGAPEHLKPFYTVSPSKITPAATTTPTTTYVNGGFKGIDTTVNNTFKFPVLLDTYPDALPILYYRRSPGVSFPVASDNMQAGDAAYYLQDNLEYTKGKLEAGGTPGTPGTGMVYDQAVQKDSQGNPTTYRALKSKDLENFARDSGANVRAKGGYMLISAGADRLYGGIPDPDPAKTT